MEQNLAILIDFENIATGTDREGLGRFDIRLIMNRFKDKGRILVARSYADWGRFAKFKQDMLMQGVRLFELTSHGMQDKNRADVALVVDCMELAFTKAYIDTFVVVSGDSDFTPLVLKLKELDKRVIGCGTRRSTSRLIVEACDEFIFYDTLKKARRAKARPEKAGRDTSERGRELQALTRGEAFNLLVDTLEGLMRENAEAVPAGILKQAMLRKEPAFSESDLGYSSYGRFLEACRDRGMIRLSRDEKAGSYRVDVPHGDEEDPEQRERPQVHSLEGEPARIYQLLESAGMGPLTPALRLEVIGALIDVVAERAGRGLKSTVRYVHQDAFKALIGGNPALSSRHVKSVVKALHQAGCFLHPNDAKPVRSQTAGFVLAEGATAEALSAKLAPIYVTTLRELGLDLAASAADVAEVIFGDRGAARQVEEIAAWESLRDEPSGQEAAAPRAPKPSAVPEPAAAEPAAAEPGAAAESPATAEPGAAAESAEGTAPADASEPAGNTEAAAPAGDTEVAASSAAPKKSPRRTAPRKKRAAEGKPEAGSATAEGKPEASPPAAETDGTPAAPQAPAVRPSATEEAAQDEAAQGATEEAAQEASGADAAAKKTTRKSTAKKSTAKKSTAKKSTAKKSTAKKSTAKKGAAKKSAAKKSAAKKSAAKKGAAKKGAAKKGAAKKSAAEKKPDLETTSEREERGERREERGGEDSPA